MARYVCSLNTNERTQLESFILSEDANKFGQTIEERKKIMNDYLESTKANWDSSVQKTITLLKLPYFLSLFNMTIKDAYDIWGIPLRWPDEVAATVAHIIDTLSSNERTKQYAEYFYNLIQPMMVGDWDATEFGFPDNSSKRAILSFQQTGNKQVQNEVLSTMPEVFSSNLGEFGMRGSVNSTDLALICERIGAPFHWCAGFGPDVLCLGKTPMTEKFMDTFLRIPKNHQSYIKEALTKVYNNLVEREEI